MESRKLISMTKFILSQRDKEYTDNITRFLKCEKYANFLSQPLELWMFVTCDENGNVLEEPKNNSYLGGRGGVDAVKLLSYENKLSEYQQAKERVLFEGWEVIQKEEDFVMIVLKNTEIYISFNKGKIHFENDFGQIYQLYNIEDLIKEDLTLTEKTAKELGL